MEDHDAEPDDEDEVATKWISQNQVPLIHDVIPLFHILSTAMSNFINNEDLHSTIHAAAL
jgi:hypothetical protein